MNGEWRSIVVAFLVLTSAARGEDWPCWRGPRGDGTSKETGIPIRWSKDENVAWKTPIPGTGHSSPVVWGDRIFLTSCLEGDEQRVLICLDRRDGKLLWQRTVLTAKLEKKHNLNSFASGTPATDGKYVWVAFLENPAMEVACYDYEGKQVWQRSPGEFHSVHGFCTSPVLYKDMVLLNGDQDALAYIVALDKETGVERWRADRPNRTRSYCTPILIEAAGRKQLVLSGSKSIASYDPDTGKQWWVIDGPTEQFVAGMIYQDGVLFMTAGFPEYHIMGIRPDGLGNVTHTHVLWHKTEARAYVPSPVAHDHYFFMVNDNGKASCWECTSGKPAWKDQQLGRHHSASPVAAAGRLYFLDDAGTTYVLKGSSQFEVVATNALGEECRASPAISRGQLFIRTLNNLYCIGKSEVGQKEK